MDANAKQLPSEEGLWDARDVAAFLKVSRSWVYQRTERGLLPCLRVGGLVRFEPAAVRAWARGEQLPPAPSARVIPLQPNAGATVKREG
ncbi:MAG: helix-turn-helix domain-containing protein [Myxococcales bacterium]